MGHRSLGRGAAGEVRKSFGDSQIGRLSLRVTKQHAEFDNGYGDTGVVVKFSMKFNSSFDGGEPPRICTFTHTARYKSVEQTATMDIEIPLSENLTMEELLAHIIVTNKIMPPFRKEFEQALRNFIDEETRKYENEIGDAYLMEFLSDENRVDLSDWVRIFSPMKNETNDSNSVPFSDCFQFIMRNSSHERIEMIISLERKMAETMNALVRARDFELERIVRECEEAVKETISDEGTPVPANAHQLSRLNEKLRQVSNNYACQIQALADRQRHEYRNLIRSLYERDEVPPEALNEIPGSVIPVFRKSNSAYANLNAVKGAHKNRLEESFTIYLGAQLKTMHNARLMTCRRLMDLCRPSDGFDVAALDTRRLHMNLSLYRRGLSGLVLLVNRDPYYHIHNKTDFAKLCEQSTELHFDSLQRQLDEVSSCLHDVCKDAASGVDGIGMRDESSLQVGDVYVTRHSNLATFQVIFHLVVDDALETDDISSRHPSINGIRNVIRLSSKCGITTFSIPLLLIENTTERMTVAWCLKRAELVFKCVKGFMMEACAGSSTAGGGPPVAATHYNVNFILPEALADSVYSQKLPLILPIEKGLFVGSTLSITATPLMNADNFYVDFLHNKEYLLHFRVDFPKGKQEVRFDFFFDSSLNGAVVRNSTYNGVWQKEERQMSQFPFTRGVTFDMIFRVGVSSIMIEINGEHFTKFGYRGDVLLKDVNKIELKGDLAVQMVAVN